MSAMVIGPTALEVRRPVAMSRRPVRSAGDERSAALRLTRRGRAVVGLVSLLASAGVFALGAHAAAGATSEVTVDRYVVQPGDTLWGIAAESRGADESVREQVRELVRLNGLSGDQVTAGEALVVPRG